MTDWLAVALIVLGILGASSEPTQAPRDPWKLAPDPGGAEHANVRLVEALLIHRLHDAREGFPTWERNVGVTARTPEHFTPKPAYCRLAAMASRPTPQGCRDE